MPKTKPDAPIFKSRGRLMFGQVREDAAVDRFLLDKALAGRNMDNTNQLARIFVIASGGCTAFSLLSTGKCSVDTLDISQAQMALVEKKVRILKNDGFEAFKVACIQPAGLNNCGWVDKRMAQLTNLFYAFVHSRAETTDFLTMSDAAEQKRYFEQTWCNWQWNLTMKVAFSRPFLYIAHGRAASYLVPDNFAEAMTARLKRALTAFPNATNPYLWQAFFGSYNLLEEALPVYLQKASQAALENNLDNLHLHCQDTIEWFCKQADDSFDYIGLSNILELLPSQYAAALKKELVRCLKPQGLVCVRAIFPKKKQTFEQMPSTAPTSERTLVLDESLSKESEIMDRSLFCNFYEIYRRTD